MAIGALTAEVVAGGIVAVADNTVGRIGDSMVEIDAAPATGVMAVGTFSSVVIGWGIAIMAI